jgi:hypothetical protein
MLPFTHDKTRSELEDHPESRFLKRDEFLRLLVSSKNVIRADDGPRGLLGLLDVQSNCRFLIEEAALDGELVSPRFQF